MDNYKLGFVEQKFAELIWQNEPISSGELVKLCLKKLEWKKSTTYTVLKKLCEKGIFQNDNGTVSSLISKDDFFALQSKNFVDETFEGSLPAFIAAFTKKQTLSKKEIEEIRKMIDAYGEV